MEEMTRIAILGAGSWGTALAIRLAKPGRALSLWVYETDLAESIAHTRINPLFLPDYKIPSSIQVSSSLQLCLKDAEIVLSAVPSQFCRTVYQQMLPFLRPEMVLVSATKGLENGTLQRMSAVIEELVSPLWQPRIAVISGPSFAREVARGDPTAIVVASHEKNVAELVQQEFSGPSLRLYSSEDVVGVELGGAVKNVIAIAAGVCTGLGYGFNTVAALMTRGVAEMTRLALACGGKRETLAGLAGMGDLVLTCTGELSRNRSVGLKLGQGQKLPDIIRSTRMVAEGVITTRAALQLAGRHQVEMPITEQMNLVLHHGKDPRHAIRNLMERRLKEE